MSAKSKQRLDLLLVQQGLAADQKVAQALILAGQVSGPDRMLDKPGMPVDSTTPLHVKGLTPYVSRAGEKLASVAVALGLDFVGKAVLDAGSSTGGFTDYALQNGAAKVYCVDVGTGQLSYKLRQDPRVVVMERTDIRQARLPEPADLALVDVSFISLQQVLESVVALIKPGAPIVALVKPQFEASKALADKYKGVIPLGDERDEVLGELREWLTTRFTIEAEIDSAVAGAQGNVERFFLLSKSQS